MAARSATSAAMDESAPAAGEDPEPEGRPAPMRADALASRQRILRAARMLGGGRHVTMAELAAAANVGRSPLYRHFPTRQALDRALGELAESNAAAPSPVSSRIATMPFRAPGHLGRVSPLALEVTRILDEVPPHLVADQLVAEARRAAGVAIALYVVDIDGSKLLRLAGTEEFPADLEAPPALGPEIVPEGLPDFVERLQRELPGCFAENRDGAWLAIADAAGTGPTAAGLGAAALGALRAARRSGDDLEQALTAMHETVRRLDNDDFYVTAIVARWRAATARFSWVNCGHAPAYLVDQDGDLSALEAPEHPALGVGGA